MPVAESVGSEYQARVEVVRVDATIEPEDARALGAFAVPLLVALRDGRERGRKLRAATAADVRALFEAALGNAPVAALGLSRSDRALRVLAGLGLAAIGLATGPRWGFVALGGVLLGFAFRDRLSGR
jgi:hypothetical protein